MDVLFVILSMIYIDRDIQKCSIQRVVSHFEIKMMHAYDSSSPRATYPRYCNYLVDDSRNLMIQILIQFRLMATLGFRQNSKKVSKKAILEVDIPQACDAIHNPQAPMALRLQSNLL